MLDVAACMNACQELSVQDFNRDRAAACEKTGGFYVMRGGKYKVIDANYVGNIARFVNHGCGKKANIDVQLWYVLSSYSFLFSHLVKVFFFL